MASGSAPTPNHSHEASTGPRPRSSRRPWPILLLAAAACAPDADVSTFVDGPVRLTALTPSLIRMEYAEDGAFEDRPTQTTGTRTDAATPLKHSFEGDDLVVQTDALTLRYRRASGPFSEDNVTIEVVDGDAEIQAHPTWGPPIRDDQTLGGWRRSLDLVDASVPLYPGILSRRGWHLVDDSRTVVLTDDAPGFATRPERSGAYQDGYFFGYGTDYRQALADLRVLAGPAPLLSRRSLGVWFSRYWSYSAQEWRELVASFRDAQVPLSVLSVDTDWKRMHDQGFCNLINGFTGARDGDACSWNGWDWNRDLYPDPRGFLDWAHAEGIEIGLNIHPSISEGDAAYPDVLALTGGLQPDDSALSCAILQGDPGNACLVFDWTQPEAVEAYFGLHRPIADDGVDFWWLDWCCDGSKAEAPGLSPDTWINRLYAAEHRRMGSRWPAFSRIGGSFQAGFDAASNDGLGALAEHRDTLHFTGDTCSTWELMGAAAAFTIAEGAIGMPYVSHDIGSFHGDRDGGVCDTTSADTPKLPDDMYVRWIQLGTYQPLDRLHSNHGLRLPWDYPGPAGDIAADFLRLRDGLVPHLYTLSRQAHDAGLPMARALYLQWPEQEAAYDHPSQFTLGDDLMVVTVAEPGDPATVAFWVPPGVWFDVFTDERLEGPSTTTRDVPLNRYPVFARAGSILPARLDASPVPAGSEDVTTLTIWPDADGTYELYEDSGTGFAYEQGAFRRTVVRHRQRAEQACREVTIDAATGDGYEGAPVARSWRIELRGASAPAEVTANGTSLGEASQAPGWSFDASTGFLTVRLDAVDPLVATRVAVGDCE